MNGKSAPIVAAAIVLGFGLLLTGCTGPASHAEHSGRAPGPTDAGKGQTNKDTVTGNVTVDAKLPSYKTVGGVSDELKSIGSDTMNNLMTLWAEGFKKKYPNVKVAIKGEGSATGPPALIESTAQFAPMSRPMKQQEIDNFEKKFGYKPVGVRTSIDMLAVYVHKDNPIKSLTLQQVDAIFSKTRKRSNDKDIRTWGDLGLTGDWADKPIALFGRNAASGTYGFFKEHVLLNGDYKNEVKEQPGSAAVVQGAASDKYAIGYSGIGYKTADVRAVPLAKDASSPPIETHPENAYSGKYPLWRFLYIYINYKPNSELDPLRREFLLYIFSKEGQQDVIKDGYLPITADVRSEDLKSVGLEK